MKQDLETFLNHSFLVRRVELRCSADFLVMLVYSVAKRNDYMLAGIVMSEGNSQ